VGYHAEPLIRVYYAAVVIGTENLPYFISTIYFVNW